MNEDQNASAPAEPEVAPEEEATSATVAPAADVVADETATDPVVAPEGAEVNTAKEGAVEIKIGDVCKCPDGRDGVVGSLDETGTLYCIPTHQN